MAFVVDKDRVRNFMEAARGLSAIQNAIVMARWGTPGINWRRSSKGLMAEAYSAGTYAGYAVSEAVIAKLFQEPRKNGFDGHGRKVAYHAEPCELLAEIGEVHS
jgi:hypothetical protein